MNQDATWWANRTASTAPGRISLEQCRKIASLYEADSKGTKAGAYINRISAGVDTSTSRKRKPRQNKSKAALPKEVHECAQYIARVKESLPKTALTNPPAWMKEFLGARTVYYAKVVTIAIVYERYGFEPFHAGNVRSMGSVKLYQDLLRKGILTLSGLANRHQLVRLQTKDKDCLDSMLKFYKEAVNGNQR